MGLRTLNTMWDASPESVSGIIYPGILPKGGILVIVGEPGVGKSFLTQQICFEIASSRRVMGLFPCNRSKVLYLELEKRSSLSRRRFVSKIWQKEYPDAGAMISYYDEEIIGMDTVAGTRLLQDMILKSEAQVVIVDSFAHTLVNESDLENIKTTIANYRTLCQNGTSFILIQHLTKKAANFDSRQSSYREAPLRLDDIRGSKFLHYEVDSVIGVVRNASERLIGFLKHSHSPVQYIDKPSISFDFLPGSSMPFCPGNKSAEILTQLDSNDKLVIDDLETRFQVTRQTLLRWLETLEQYEFIEHLGVSGGRGIKSYITTKKWEF